MKKPASPRFNPWLLLQNSWTTLERVCKAVCLFARKTRLQFDGFSWNFVLKFLLRSDHKISFCYNRKQMPGTTREDLCTCLISTHRPMPAALTTGANSTGHLKQSQQNHEQQHECEAFHRYWFLATAYPTAQTSHRVLAEPAQIRTHGRGVSIMTASMSSFPLWRKETLARALATGTYSKHKYSQPRPHLRLRTYTKTAHFWSPFPLSEIPNPYLWKRGGQRSSW
jgi:hypothetical protein